MGPCGLTLICPFFVPLGVCLPISHPVGEAFNPEWPTRQSGIVQPLKRAGSCGFVGNSDIYGLGIRLGIYLQWLTSLIANHHSHEDIRSNLDTNVLFLLAIFIATVVATLGESLQSAEVVILLHLCFGSVFSVLSIWGRRARSTAQGIVRFPALGSAFRLLLTTGVSGYAIWFWFRGVASLDRPPCFTYTFLLRKVHLGGAVVRFFQVQTTLIMVLYSLFLLPEVLLLPCFFALASLKGLVAAAFVLYARRMKKGTKRRRNTWNLLRSWVYNTAIIYWSLVNSENSGFDRPQLTNWVAVLFNVVILFCRSALQVLCLAVCRKCLPMGFPPLLTIPFFALKPNSIMVFSQRLRKSVR